VNRAVVWFRRDLSLADNPAFGDATSFDEVACLWVLEPSLLASCDSYRLAHLGSALHSLADDLASRGGRLAVVAGPAESAVPTFAAGVGANAVLWNGDVGAYSQRRDGAVRDALERQGVASSTHWGTLVQPPMSVVTAAGSVPRVFKRFFDLWSALPIPSTPSHGSARLLDVAGEAQLPTFERRVDDGCEGGAQRRLEQFLADVDQYAETRDRPDLEGTSRLSTDLRFGTITPRQVARAVGAATPGRRAYVRQLAWRDWYAHLLFENPGLQFRAQQPAYDTVAWRNDPDEIDAWRTGHTGYPFVDAAMRELAATGWMHGRVRMVTASFLVKDLLVDWRVGERHFRRLLVDGDVPQNVGNWQWSAGTGPDAAPYFRIMNPTVQGQRFDPDGEYVRRWVPELAALPGASIHTPSELGPLELAAAGVTLGVTYPAPIVNHAEARARVLSAYAAARQAAELT
jgi:deoxyribodipyrimidine photo-lyase